MGIKYLVERVVKNETYLRAIEISKGNTTINEITKDGNLEMSIIMPDITKEEIRLFMACDPAVYFDDVDGKGVVFYNFKISLEETTLNPNNYDDDRWEKFKEGACKEFKVFLIDSMTKKVVAGKVFDLRGNTLAKIRKSCEMNVAYKKEELEGWRQRVLYKNSIKDNMKKAVYVGKCFENKEIEVVFR